MMTKNKKTASATQVLAVLTKIANESEDDVVWEATADDDDGWAAQLVASVQPRIAELRRRRTPLEVPVRKLPPIRASTLVLSRPALLQGIAGFSEEAQYAHRSFRGISDNDLRRIYDLLDPATRVEPGEPE